MTRRIIHIKANADIATQEAEGKEFEVYKTKHSLMYRQKHVEKTIKKVQFADEKKENEYKCECVIL